MVFHFQGMGSVNPIVGSARTRAVEAPSKKNNKTRIGTSGETVDSRKVHWFTRLYSCIQHCIIHTCSTRTKSRCIDTQVRDTYVYFRFISRFIYAIYIYIRIHRRCCSQKFQTLWNIYIVLKYLYRLNSILNETSKRSGTRVIRVILENFLDRLSERDEKNKRGWYMRLLVFPLISDYQIFMHDLTTDNKARSNLSVYFYVYFVEFIIGITLVSRDKIIFPK